MRSGGHSFHSQADSAGSIPVTRSKREKCCSTSESDCISQAGQRSFASENGTRAITRAHWPSWRVPLETVSSPADSAGSIPVTRRTHERTLQHNRIGGFQASADPCCRSMRGPHWATDIHTSTLIFSSEGRSACSITFSGCPFSGSSNRTQGVSPQARARCERAELQHREETRPVIQCTRRR